MGQAMCFVQISFIKFGTVSHKLGRGRQGEPGPGKNPGWFLQCRGLRRRPASDQVLPGLCKLPGWGKSTTAFPVLWLAGLPALDQWEERKVRERKTPELVVSAIPRHSVRYRSLARSELRSVGDPRAREPVSAQARLRTQSGPGVTQSCGAWDPGACCRLLLNTSQDQSNEAAACCMVKTGTKSLALNWDVSVFQLRRVVGVTSSLCSCDQ